MNNIIIVILVALSFGLLVFGHELGHFLLAKFNKVKVEEFALGMGPAIFKIKGKETLYSIRILPIGGYVKMLGEYDGDEEVIDESERNRAYTYKHPLRKISIILAGPIMNFILAFVILLGIALFSGFSTTTIGEVVDGSPAQIAGLKTGDDILKINSDNVLGWQDFVFKLQQIKDTNVKITVLRDNQKFDLDVIPSIQEGSKLIGIKSFYDEKPGFFESISYAFNETIFQIKQVFWSLWQLVTGGASFSDLGGPITIFRASGKAAETGFSSLMNFTAFLSVNLGVFNLIPFPALDGGSFIINLIELIFKKKIKQEVLAKINYIGFGLLILLMIVVTLKDIFFPISL